MRRNLPVKQKERRHRDASPSPEDDRNYRRDARYVRGDPRDDDREDDSQTAGEEDSRASSIRGARPGARDATDIKDLSPRDRSRGGIGPTCISSGCIMLPFFEGLIPLKNVSCPCGTGYWNIFREEFINGERVRNGEEDKRSVYEAKTNILGAEEVEARLRDQFVEHFSLCPNTASFNMDDLAQENGGYAVQRAIADWKEHRGRSQSLGPVRNAKLSSTNDARRPVSTRPGQRRDEFREQAREDPRDERKRTNREDYRDEFRSSREDTIGKARETLDRRDSSGRSLVPAFVPCGGIEEQVITEDIKTYLGPGATVKQGWHPEDERVKVYHMKGNHTLTKSMIEDLQVDSIRWKEEQRRKDRLISYASSDTHKKRLEGGQSRSGARPIPARESTDSRDRDRLNRSHNSRDLVVRDRRKMRDGRDSRPGQEELDIQDSREMRDGREFGSVLDSRPSPVHRDSVERGEGRPGGVNQRESRDTISRQGPEARLAIDSRSPAERGENSLHSAKSSGDSGYATSTSAGTSARTDRTESQEAVTRKEAEALIARKLKQQGRSNISREQLKRLVDEYMDRNNDRDKADGEKREERSRDFRGKGAR